MSVLLRNNLALENFFYPIDKAKLSGVLSCAIKLFGEDRRKGWGCQTLESNRNFVQKTKAVKLSQALSPNGKNSLTFLNLRLQGKLTIGDLSANELDSLRRFLPTNLIDFAKAVLAIPTEALACSQWLYPLKNALVKLNSLNSKSIRLAREDNEPICLFKIGPILGPAEALNWSNTLSKLTSTRHKDILLRFMHGELYSKERLHRYGLTQSPNCQRCNQVETLKHKYLECPYIKEIWRRTLALTNRLRNGAPNEPLIDRVMACPEPNRTILTIHAEMLLEIRRLKDDARHLTLPKILLRKALERLSRREVLNKVQEDLNDLLDHC